MKQSSANLPPMPRGPRLDAPGILHHVMVGGIERPGERPGRRRPRRLPRATRRAGPGRGRDCGRLGLAPDSRAPAPPDRDASPQLEPAVPAYRLRGRLQPTSPAHRPPPPEPVQAVVLEAEPYRLELTRYLHLNPVRAEVVPEHRGLGRSRQIARARAGVAYLWCRMAGQSGHLLAAALGLWHQAVSDAAARGAREGPRWEAVWRTLP